VRYLSLAQAFLIAEQVTKIPCDVLIRVSRSELLDSALHAPQAGLGDVDFYEDFFSKAAVLCSRISTNHPLPDGNKRLAWMCLVVFCDINEYELHVPIEDAVDTMVNVAAGQVSEEELADWIRKHASPRSEK
jgi:death on curing protein